MGFRRKAELASHSESHDIVTFFRYKYKYAEKVGATIPLGFPWYGDNLSANWEFWSLIKKYTISSSDLITKLAKLRRFQSLGNYPDGTWYYGKQASTGLNEPVLVPVIRDGASDNDVYQCFHECSNSFECFPIWSSEKSDQFGNQATFTKVSKWLRWKRLKEREQRPTKD